MGAGGVPRDWEPTERCRLQVELRSVWERKLESALKVVGAAADLWSAKGTDALEVDSLPIAREWSKGDPENPATEHVLNMVVHALFESRLGKWPASPKFRSDFRNA
jgi:hypothetical protein